MAENLVIERIFTFMSSIFSGMLKDIIFAIIILLVGFVIARMLGKITQRVLNEIELNNILRSVMNIKFSSEELIGKIISYIIYFFVIIMALNQLGIATTILYIISIGIMAIIIIIFLLSVRDFIPNLFAGLSIQKKNFLKKGDFIEYKGIIGEITHFTLIETRIETKKKEIINIPNNLLLKNEVKKISKTQARKNSEDKSENKVTEKENKQKVKKNKVN
jgi:small conductance mechanosensitive channel